MILDLCMEAALNLSSTRLRWAGTNFKSGVLSTPVRVLRHEQPYCFYKHSFHFIFRNVYRGCSRLSRMIRCIFPYRSDLFAIVLPRDGALLPILPAFVAGSMNHDLK